MTSIIFSRTTLREIIKSAEYTSWKILYRTNRLKKKKKKKKNVLSPKPGGKNYHRIDVVFDRYRDDTIKAGTRTWNTQAAHLIRRVIENHDVPLPRNFLSLSENKPYLGHFLSKELCSWATSEQEVAVAGGFKDEREVRSSKTSTDIAQLRATHEEADTRLVLRALNCPFEVLVVSSKDTDVLVMLLAHFPNMQCEHLWMRSGTAKQHKDIPIRETFNNLLRGAVEVAVC